MYHIWVDALELMVQDEGDEFAKQEILDVSR